MDYKKIIPNQDLRLKLLELVDFIPDKMMINLQYMIKTGRRLNLKYPTRYNEKLQWYKLYYRDPLMTQCADKYEVRNYVISKGLKDILVPLYGVFGNTDYIDFDSLPAKFVFKTNNSSQTNIICENKSTLNFQKTKETLQKWLYERTPKAGREWAYYDIEPKIICEKFLESESGDLIDYKFYCFNGKPHYIKVATNTNHYDGPENGIFNMKFEQLPYCRREVPRITTKIEKPKNYKLMCEIAATLSKDFPHVRVDLYNLNGIIYFGELTFYDTSGYQIFEPDDFDFILGDLFKLDKMFF